MITTSIPTLQIHKLSQAQYDAAKAAGTLDDNAIYLTPDEGGGGNMISITIPAGRMRGDVDGDGKITEADLNLINGHSNGSPLTDEIQLLCADVDCNGRITSLDKARINGVLTGTLKIGAFCTDITGNWTVNANYSTEDAQFYTDITVANMTTTSSATVIINGNVDANMLTHAECHDGFIRIYATLCPINPISATVTFGAGDGSVIIIKPTVIANAGSAASSIIIPAGRMKGDINGDGKITGSLANISDLSTDIALLYNHIVSNAPLDEIQLLCADINGDGTANYSDIQLIANISNCTTKAGKSSDITGNWTVNPNYETEEAQFYTDIPVEGMTVTSSALVTVNGVFESGFFTKAECIEGAIRIYARLCPIEAVEAFVVFGPGDGNVVLSYRTNLGVPNSLIATDDGNGNLTITLG